MKLISRIRFGRPEGKGGSQKGGIIQREYFAGCEDHGTFMSVSEPHYSKKQNCCCTGLCLTEATIIIIIIIIHQHLYSTSPMTDSIPFESETMGLEKRPLVLMD